MAEKQAVLSDEMQAAFELLFEDITFACDTVGLRRAHNKHREQLMPFVSECFVDHDLPEITSERLGRALETTDQILKLMGVKHFTVREPVIT